MAKLIQIEIETRIRHVSWASFQAGQKSIQRVEIDFEKPGISESCLTGHTAIAGLSLGSVRDKFKMHGARFSNSSTAVFQVTGQTASGVGAMPDIDYSFDFEVTENTVKFSGAHDGYPSYNIAVNGTSAYDYVQGHLGQLFGTSDVSVPSTSVAVPQPKDA